MSDGPAARWSFQRSRGSAAAFHATPLPDPAVPTVWMFDVRRPAVVLGSTQSLDVVDQSTADAAGIEVVRRRSGGGAVYVAPGELVWLDVVLPAGDPEWTDDVGRSFDWLGAIWVDVLQSMGVADAVAHPGPMVRGPWSDLVCFAGLGPGEVLAGNQKVVGISQRRTRAAARFQCAVLRSWDPEPLLAVLDLSEPQRREAALALRPVARGLDLDGVDGLISSFLERLEQPLA